jgi:hypothetical protein
LSFLHLCLHYKVDIYVTLYIFCLKYCVLYYTVFICVELTRKTRATIPCRHRTAISLCFLFLLRSFSLCVARSNGSLTLHDQYISQVSRDLFTSHRSIIRHVMHVLVDRLRIYYGAFATWRKASVSFLMSIARLSTCKNWASTRQIFIKFDI